MRGESGMNMDRLKYRAYFNFAEHGWKMVELKQFYFVESTIYIEPMEMEGDIYGGTLDDCILIQSTGLKDSEGNLIYEGDVVECQDQFRKGDLGYIVWDENRWKIQDIGKRSHAVYPMKQMKVLGNIYEHKHLLEADEK